MIDLPRRSVTRFFIPLIDVLTVLFCIFLIMPLIRGDDSGVESQPEPVKEELPAQANEANTTALAEAAQREKARLRKEQQALEGSKQERREFLQRNLLVRVLEIDADTGKLYYPEAEERRAIGSQADALALIARHREEAETRDLYYLFLYPRQRTGFPTQKQILQYEEWFKGVAHSLDSAQQAR